MQSISKTRITRILIIINLILLIAVIFTLINLNNTLSISTIHKEITREFGKDYDIDVFNLDGGIIVVSASVPEDKYIELDYIERVDQLKNSLTQYKTNPDNINKTILNISYHDTDTKYGVYTTDIDL